MDYTTYKLIHLVGLMILFTGFGGLLFAPKGDAGKLPKMVLILHGLGLLVMLFGGFGMHARLQDTLPDDEKGFPLWLISKLVIWLLLGALPVIARKAKLPGGLTFLLAIGLAGTSVAFVIEGLLRNVFD